MKSQVQYSKTQFSLLLIHLSCQILKICFTAFEFIDHEKKTLWTPSIKVAWSRKSESSKMNRLPLIFGCFHSRDSQLHKCSFCSIKIIFIPKIPQFVWRVMFRNPKARVVTTTQMKIPNSIRNVHRNMSNVFIINPQVVFKIYIR